MKLEILEKEAEVKRLEYKKQQLGNLDEEKYEIFADGDSQIWKSGYIAGRTKSIESERLKDEKIKELENCLQEFVKNVEHSIIESGVIMDLPYITKAKQLLNK